MKELVDMLNNKSPYYILEGNVPKNVSIEEFVNRQTLKTFIVKKTKVDKYEVSTVFLGLDHSFGIEGELVLFETMIFSLDNNTQAFNDFQRRYTSRNEALRGHELCVDILKTKNIEKLKELM